MEIFFYLVEIPYFYIINQLKHLDMKNLLGFLTCALIGFFTLTGDIQTFIHFAGVANEMTFCLLAFMMAGGFLILAFDRKKEKKIHQ